MFGVYKLKSVELYKGKAAIQDITVTNVPLPFCKATVRGTGGRERGKKLSNKQICLAEWLDSILFEKQGHYDRQRGNRDFPIETLELSCFTGAYHGQGLKTLFIVS